MTSTLTGQIEHITFTNEENGFTIARVRLQESSDTVTVVGHLLAPTPGEILQMHGEWHRHPRFGRQFKVERCQTVVPATASGIRKYLGSGMIKGLGPVMAGRIVEKFGEQTLDVIDSQIQRLAEVDGIGEKRIAQIKSAWQAQREIRDVMVFLQDHGVSGTYAAKIFKQYGGRSVAVVRSNPFRLADDISGIGFLTADRIAAGLGIARDSPERIRAGILFVLHQLADEGHVFFPFADLVARCGEILSVEEAVVVTALNRLAGDRKVVVEERGDTDDPQRADCRIVYLTRMHLCETVVAERLMRLIRSPSALRPVDCQKAIEWVQRQLTMSLADNQAAAVRSALKSKVLVVTGGPGTGKTTIVKAILLIYRRMRAGVLLAAPTGRAAKRLAEACGHEAKTLHRMLEYSLQQGGFQRNEENPLQGDVLIVDEASMIDTVLMYHLLKAVPAGATLILVGDVNQLPSVGAGNVLADIIDSQAVTVCRLDKIFRQARASRIVLSAHAINAGRLPSLGPDSGGGCNDFFFIEQDDPQRAVEIIRELVEVRIPQRFSLDADDIQVLSPMHKGLLGAGNLNRVLQDALNRGTEGIARGEQKFMVADKVMQIRNNYDKDVFNGDIGKILRIDPAAREVSVNFEGRDVIYDFSELDEIMLAYAVSVHKSQGSEYPAVVIPIHTQHYVLLQRNLIYTAVTRGRRLVVMVGSRKALAIGVNNHGPRHRHTGLRQRLQR